LCYFLLGSPIYLTGGVCTGELRFAAKTLFDAGVASLTDEETISLVDRWQHSRKDILCPAVTSNGDLLPETIQYPFYFQTRKEDLPLPQRLYFSADSLPLVNIVCFPQGFYFSCSPVMRSF
jgi:hypothetical protein